jgi:hypothetical protein
MHILAGFPGPGDQRGNSGPDDPAQFLGRDGPFVVAVVGQARTDPAQDLIETLFGGVSVEADDERVSEAALVRGMRGAQGGPRGRRHAVQRSWRRLGGERLGQIGVREVVAGLVGRREQGAEVGVRAMGDEPLRPAAVSAAGEQGGLGLAGRGGVEPVEAVAGAGVGCAGQRGLLERGLKANGLTAGAWKQVVETGQGGKSWNRVVDLGLRDRRTKARGGCTGGSRKRGMSLHAIDGR